MYEDLMPGDILTKVTRYNLIRNQRMLYIDIHQALCGKLAGPYIAVPNLVNIVAPQILQGVGEDAQTALHDCLRKIKGLSVEEIFKSTE